MSAGMQFAAVAAATLAPALGLAPAGRRPPSAARGAGGGAVLPPPSEARQQPAWRPSPLLIAGVLGVGALAAGRATLGVAAAVLVLTVRHLVQRTGRARAAQRAQQDAVLALRALRADLDSGKDVAGALAEGRLALDPVPRVAAALEAALTVSRQTGAPLADLVARLAAVESAAATAGHELEAALAGPRTSGRLLAVLPAAGCLLGSLSGARTIPFLTGTGVGGVCLLLGVLLDATGLLWLDRLASAADGTSTGPSKAS